jgi:hypothetical protein
MGNAQHGQAGMSWHGNSPAQSPHTGTPPFPAGIPHKQQSGGINASSWEVNERQLRKLVISAAFAPSTSS